MFDKRFPGFNGFEHIIFYFPDLFQFPFEVFLGREVFAFLRERGHAVLLHPAAPIVKWFISTVGAFLILGVYRLATGRRTAL